MAYIGEERERLEKLVQDLRDQGDPSYKDKNLGKILNDAADAIEHLQAESNRKTDETLMMVMGICPQCKVRGTRKNITCADCGYDGPKVDDK